MRKRWFIIIAVVALTVTIVGASEVERSKAFYYYSDTRVPLTVVPDDMSVGKSGKDSMFSQAILQVEAGTVEIQATQLGANTWRLRLDRQGSLKTTTHLQTGPVIRPITTVDQPTKELQNTQRVERQLQAIETLLNDETVDWAYPAYRNTETGTLLWLTPRVIVGVNPSIEQEDIEGLLPPELRLVRPQSQTNHYLLELVDPQSDNPLDVSVRLQEDIWWIEWAEPDFIQDWKRASTPNDPLFSDQWHLQNTGQGGGTSGADARLPGAWDLETGDSSVIVAVIDDGVETTHPDLPIFTNPGEIPSNGVDDDGNGFVDDVNGWDFFYGDNDSNPDLTGPGSHGTAVAGVAAATGDNSAGVSGACQNCTILPVRVFNATSGASNSAFGEAIVYAGQFADVLNNSWGGGSPSTEITTAIQGAVANGRGGLGSPTLISTANSASGFIRFTLQGFPAGTFTIAWDYVKDGSVDAGFDTAWIDNVTFPDGTTEDFETCTSLPSGWTTSGDASWQTVDDGKRASSAWGGHCSIGAGTITHNQSTSVTVTKTFAVAGDLTFYVWPSSEVNPGPTGPITTSCYDYLGITVNDVDQGLNLCGTYSNQNRPLQDGVIAYPANLSDSIAVGAATNFDRRADYSQWGPEIDFLCHSNGGSLGITTTDVSGANGYTATDYTSTFGGTSSAAPLCSGIAALAIAADPTLTASEIRQIMRDSGRKIGSYTYAGGWNEKYGFGAVDASAVISAAIPASGGIIVEKQTIPDGDGSSFTFTGDASGSIGDGQQIVSVTGTGTFSSTETVPAGWSLFEIECDDSDSTGNIGTASATFNVAADETVTCVFTNCSDSHSMVDLSGVTVTGTETFVACDTLTADTFEVESTGNAHFRAGSGITLENGFSVASGGLFTAEIVGSL
jgi:subtilisin family serine protease